MRPHARLRAAAVIMAAASALAAGCGAGTSAAVAPTSTRTAAVARPVTSAPVTPIPTPVPRKTVVPTRAAHRAPRTALHTAPHTATPRVTPPRRSTTPPAVVSSKPVASQPATLLRVPTGASSAITVTAAGYGTSTAVFEAWTRSGSGWRPMFGPWTAHLGYNGLAPAGSKREGDGRTPTGVYGFSYLFGVEADPGVALRWRAVTGTYDVWDDDSTSPNYNEWVDTRTGSAGVRPEPMDNVPSYDEGAVIAYNTARTPGLGSAIFLHVSDGGSTAGCVSIPQSALTPVLRWIATGTVISIGVA